MTPRDRRAAVLASSAYNGIDFVEIADDAQTELRVHFLNSVAVKGTLVGRPSITGGETIPSVAVLPIAAADWSFDEQHVVLTLRVGAPGDFSTYRLSVPSPALDPFFASVAFSFKAGCPTTLDCRVTPAPCPPTQANAPPIDYLAKDFLSFRQALLDFSALRYPDWQERSEADFGVMMLEALSAVADDLSYTQDRIAAEAALSTATQRRSVVRHARLVDYEPRPSSAAATLLQFDVDRGVDGIAHGLPVIAPGPDGSPVVFETGTGLLDRLIDALTGKLRAAPPQSPANPLWNAGRITPYWFDDSQRCLRRGATSMDVLGWGWDFLPGQSLLIETAAQSPADPPIRQIVQLLDVGDVAGPWATLLQDPLFPRAPSAGPPWLAVPQSPPGAMAPTAVTRIAWRSQDALLADRDLTRTTLAGNIVPATQGRTVSAEPFVIGAAPAGDPTPPALVRTGARMTQPDGTAGTTSDLQLYTLAAAPLAWLVHPGLDAGAPLPEIVLTQQDTAGDTVVWSWFRRLLDAGQFDAAFTIDAARYAPLGRNSDQSMQYEYDGDGGDTLRFGDGVFGLAPEGGARFAATYRVGAGSAGNVAAGAISRLGPAAVAANLLAVTNPLPASGGADPEPIARVARLAPQAFRATTYRAVIPADYQAAAQTLPWVQRAGTAFRWTGSWLSVFTTPDPRGSEQVTTAQRTGLIDLLNRYRMAGYESYVPDPRYVSIDLEIELCATPTAFRADVRMAVLAVLSASGSGFFAPDNFTFGQPLERSALEAAIQGVTGVAGVLCVHYRRRDRMLRFVEMTGPVTVASNQIIRCDNDPSLAEHGSLQVTVEGGR